MVMNFLASMSYYGGGAFGNMLAQWEQMGIFAYALPFLLIFALVFGILTAVNIFKENKSINAIIALVVALMSLQFGFVPVFFSELFPRFGVGLGVILIILIAGGLFAPDKPWLTYTLLTIVGIIIIVVLINTFTAIGWPLGNLAPWNWEDLLPWIAIAIALIVAVSASAKPDENSLKSIFTKAIGGN